MYCEICQTNFASRIFGVCGKCASKKFTIPQLITLHLELRKQQSNLEYSYLEGISCGLCLLNCKISENKFGLCGLRKNINGELEIIGGSTEKGVLSYYYDPLPTNCVANWVCGGSKDVGFYNLAIFYESCNFNCLFCQNWHYRNGYKKILKKKFITSNELANAVTDRTRCVCFFGGDPATQIANSIHSAKLMMKKDNIHICWETNGSINREVLEIITDIALESGGIIKFDLKTVDKFLSYLISGVNNEKILESIVYITKKYSRINPSLFVFSTPVIPGYIEVEEVSKIANFISSIDPEMPYSLLGFYPQFYFSDLPLTTSQLAERCFAAAKDVGLKNVNIGNKHILIDEKFIGSIM